MAGTQLVTGATGLVGAALVLELLRRTEDSIVCPTRPKGSSPGARLTQALEGAARAYGFGDSLDAEIAGRCGAVPADLAEPLCGVEPALIPQGVEEFWHCAADLSYEDRHWEALQRTNIAGTQQAVRLAQVLGCTVYNQVSTAYVAGRLDGVLSEQPGDVRNVNNRYEESKVGGEHIVTSATGMTRRIMRPSIVIGHSVTKQAVGGLTGAYGVLQRLALAQRALARTDAETAASVRLPADPVTPINFVPVDLLVADAVSVSLSGAADGIFHLTHPSPLPIGVSLDLMCDLVGLARPRFSLSREDLTGIDRLIGRQMDFYTSYMRGAKTFDQTNLLAAVPDSALAAWQLDVADLTEFWLWFLHHIGHPVDGPQLTAASTH